METETDLARTLIESLSIPLALADDTLRLLTSNDAFRALTEDSGGFGQPLRTRLLELDRSSSFEFDYQPS